MNLHTIFSAIEKADPEVYGRLDARRNVIKRFAKTGGRLALTAVPLALGSLFKSAYAQTGTSIENVLQYALTLEYLEAEFYKKAVDAADLLPAGAPKAAITAIRDHEVAHVAFLTTVLESMGKTPVSKPDFDFTGGKGSGNGPFAAAFSDYDLFLAVAQTFEDTGVRAYKGQAANLMSSNEVLTAALQIHSVEARHASHIRNMRRARASSTTIKPWITGKDTGGIGDIVQASYNGEELSKQANINIVNINGNQISEAAATESFDEPLTMEQVLAIVDPFLPA
ncbi:MAG: ferritin-like domain-containing protein [Agriterribacter sp.]